MYMIFGIEVLILVACLLVLIQGLVNALIEYDKAKEANQKLKEDA